MKRITAYVVFALVYGGLLLLAAFVVGEPGSGAAGVVMGWVAPFVVAPAALLVATRLGSLSILGVVITCLVLAACDCIAIVSILVAIAVPVVGGPTFEYVVGAFASYFTIGGWRLLLSLMLFVAAPVLWSVLLGRRPPEVLVAN